MNPIYSQITKKRVNKSVLRIVAMFLLPILSLAPPLIERVRGLHSTELETFTMVFIIVVSVISGSLLVILDNRKCEEKRVFELIQNVFLAFLVFVSMDIGLGGIKICESVSPFPAYYPSWHTLLFHFTVMIFVIALTALLITKLRHNALPILVALFGVIFVSTLFISSHPPLDNWTKNNSRKLTESRNVLPTRIYMFLDGMEGINGIDRSVSSGAEAYKKAIEFHKKFGFTQFGNAFSRHHATRQSIPASLNYNFLGTEGLEPPPTKEVNNLIIQNKNRHFDQISKYSENLVVYQTPYLNLCQHSAVQRCETLDIYNPYSKYMPADFPDLHVTFLINGLRAVLAENSIVGNYLTLMADWINRLFVDYSPYALNDGSNFSGHTASLWFDEFKSEVARSKLGSTFIGHFMFPHDPWMNSSECKIVNWKLKWGGQVAHLRSLQGADLETQTERMKTAYYQQVICAYKKLDAMMRMLEEKNMLNSTMVVLLGDHGSRISREFDQQKLSKKETVNRTV